MADSINEKSTISHAAARIAYDDARHILLDEKALAARWGVSVRTLQNQRVAGGGLPFLKLGRSVRYRLNDILERENASLRTSTSEGGVDA